MRRRDFLCAGLAAAAATAWRFSFNKGLAGAADDVIAAARETPVNPDVASAFALAIIDTPNTPAEASLEMEQSRARAKRVGDAMTALREAAPSSGCYFNECDFFQEHWQRGQWGDNYDRLAKIKQRYDPQGLFYVHHGVGSESWSADGFTRSA